MAFLKIPGAMQSIIAEMNTLAYKDSEGLSELAPARLNGPRFATCPGIFRTMAVKMKTPVRFKATLCARGDMIKCSATADASSPTAARCTQRLALSLSLTMWLELGIVDISCAFAQSYLVRPSQLCVLMLPWYLESPWVGQLTLAKSKHCTTPLGAIIAHPIYGATCDPQGWLCKITDSPKKEKWSQCSIDPCVFRKLTRTLCLTFPLSMSMANLLGVCAVDWDVFIMLLLSTNIVDCIC